MGPKAQRVGAFGGYVLHDDAVVSVGVRGWSIKGATATFSLGPTLYGKSTGRALMLGVMAGATDNTECFVVITLADGSSLTLRGLARTDYQLGQQMAKAICDMSGIDQSQVQQAQAAWNAQANRWELNGQYWNGSAWELI